MAHEIDKLRTELSRIKEVLTERDESIKELQETIEIQEAEVLAFKHEATSTILKLQNELVAMKPETPESTRYHMHSVSEKSTKECDIDQIVSEFTNLKKCFEAQKERLHTCEDQLTGLRTKIQSLDTEKQTIESNLSNKESDIDSIRFSMIKYKEESVKAIKEIEAIAEQRLLALQEENKVLNTMLSQLKENPQMPIVPSSPSPNHKMKPSVNDKTPTVDRFSSASPKSWMVNYKEDTPVSKKTESNQSENNLLFLKDEIECFEYVKDKSSSRMNLSPRVDSSKLPTFAKNITTGSSPHRVSVEKASSTVPSIESKPVIEVQLQAKTQPNSNSYAWLLSIFLWPISLYVGLLYYSLYLLGVSKPRKTRSSAKPLVTNLEDDKNRNLATSTIAKHPDDCSMHELTYRSTGSDT